MSNERLAGAYGVGLVLDAFMPCIANPDALPLIEVCCVLRVAP